MPIDYRQEAPQLLLDSLSYHETIKATPSGLWTSIFWICGIFSAT